MEYLLFLQKLREGVPDGINQFAAAVAEFSISPYAIILVAMIYWCVSKRAGLLTLMSYPLAFLFNGVIKGICRIERPFVRDPRIIPYTSAYGYSFPSGHSMMGTAMYGSLGVSFRKRRGIAVFFAAMTLFTAFMRNWVGVHTFEDVAVGFLVSCALITVNSLGLNFVDRRPELDWVMFLAGIAVVAGCYLLDPSSLLMMGMYLGTMIGWIIERRFIKFEVEKCVVCRILFAVGGAATLGLLNSVVLPAVCAPMGAAGQFVKNFVLFLAIVAGWPAVMAAVSRIRGKRAACDC